VVRGMLVARSMPRLHSGHKGAWRLASIRARIQPISDQMGNPLRSEDEVELEKTLRLIEFDQARGQMRRTRGRRTSRKAQTGFVVALVAAALIGLFYLGMQWLVGFFSRGTAWRG